MGIHVSLPNELETKVHEKVKTGMYGSVSEVVREALRNFFADEEQGSTGLTADHMYSLMFSDALDEYESGQAVIQDQVAEQMQAIRIKHVGP